MRSGETHSQWGWFVVVIGLVLLGLCSLTPSPVAFMVGAVLFVAGVSIVLVGPYLRGQRHGAEVTEPTDRDPASNH